MRLRSILYIIYLSLFFLGATAQDKTLSIENTLDIVRNFHPVVKQSFLQNSIAKNELTAAKSNFDPTVQINTQEKKFDDLLYYRYNNAELKIPTWYGIDIKAGIENNIGEKTDPALSKYRNSYIGASIDPLRGIIVDKRRAFVNQAKYFVELTKNEQRLVVNDLILDASTAYWNWVNAYYVNELFKKSVVNNQQRFEMVKKAYLSGDRAAIDTTEALTQLQSVEMMQIQAQNELQKSKNELSNFFWTQNGTPYSLEESVVPEQSVISNQYAKLELDNVDQTIEVSMRSHPKIQMINQKLSILDIEKKLKTIELFPSLKMNYNILEKNYALPGSINSNNNYKYGVAINFPLFQRQARGDLGKTKNKIENTGWDRKYLSLEIENKIRNSYLEFQALKQQLVFSESTLVANKLLFDTETIKFNIGESSIFLINSREMKYLETEQKNIALKTKFYNSIYKSKWAAGNLQ
jgi:outer membrane protein TolC